MKTGKIIYTFLLSVLFTLTILGFSDNIAKATTTTAPNYRFRAGNTNVADGTDFELTRDTVSLSVVDGSGGAAPSSVKWTSSEMGVVTVDSSTNSTINMQRKGPGYSTISAAFTQNGVNYTISFVVKVSLDINYTDTHANLRIVLNDKNPALELDTTTHKSETIILKYVDYDTVAGAAINSDMVTFESSNTGVVTVDSTGKVTAVGAGTADITITSATTSSKNNSLSNSLKVVVAPTFSFTSGGVTRSSSDDVNDSSAVYQGIPSEFTLNSNAMPAENLTWKIYSVVNGKRTLLSTTSDLLDYSISNLSGSVTFKNIKAGTYEIFAFDVDCDPAIDKYNNAPYAYMKIIVLPSVTTMNLVMGVHDTYNLIDNTNISDPKDFYVANTYTTSIAYLNQSTDIITANKQGDVTIILRYNGGQNIYDNSVVVPDIVINISVIDGISLSTTNATIFTKGTLKLEPIVTNGTSTISWSSADPTIATVVDGLVTGVKAGTTIITATQTVDGVVKKATCVITVQQSVATITLDPGTKTLALNEFLTIHANITPAGLQNITIQWRSSNDKVVKITETNGLTATVQALSGGHAVISAINQDNVVVGFCDITVQQPVTSIALSDTNITANLTLKNIQLRATVSPDNAVVKDVIWSSTDTSKATVNANGLVTLLKPGTVSIVATSKDNPAAVAYCNLNIQIPVASLSLDETVKTMYVGQSARLSYVLLPANASNNAVTWVSTNATVATVDATGKVSAKSVGTTVIMLRSVDGGISTYCTLTVKQVATGIKFDVTDLKLKTGESYSLTVTLTPKGSTDNSIVWESSDTKIATIDAQGKITAKSAGSAIIMARTESGGVAYCKVTVTQAVTGLVLNYTEKTIFIGQTFTLEASISPSTASKMDVIWKSSNPKIATVSNRGDVKGLIGGVVVITCTTADGGFSATCMVSVKEPVTKITLNYESYKLGIDKSFKLVATVTNDTATNQKVKWTSSNNKVAIVSSTGKVTGLSSGYATITATATDGSDVDASCEIRVVTLVSNINLNKSSLSMFIGESKKLKATISPSKATYKKAKWTTSDPNIAIVDDSGVVIGVKAGSVLITAEAVDSSGKKAICYVTVYDRVAATGVTLQDKKVTMVSGENKIVEMVLIPGNATDDVTWSSDNVAVASVNKDTGKITAKAPGTAYITVMTDSGKTATVEITVIGLNQTVIYAEQYTNYSLSVDGATGPISWHSDNPLVAVVYSDGTVSTRGVGTAIITATVNGRKLTCKVIVKKIT